VGNDLAAVIDHDADEHHRYSIHRLNPAWFRIGGRAAAGSKPCAHRSDLATDIQVAGPQEGGEDTVRFALTSEAGLNDGFAFPFVHLTIVLSLAATAGEPWFARWLP